MINKSGNCKVDSCNRKQQPGTNGYCNRCFKIYTEKQNTQTLGIMSQLLVKMGAQLSELSCRVDNLEIVPITKVETIIQKQKLDSDRLQNDKTQYVLEDEPDDLFIPSLNASEVNSSSVVTKADVKKNKDINLAVKKLKIIQDTSQKIK